MARQGWLQTVFRSFRVFSLILPDLSFSDYDYTTSTARNSTHWLPMEFETKVMGYVNMNECYNEFIAISGPPISLISRALGKMVDGQRTSAPYDTNDVTASHDPRERCETLFMKAQWDTISKPGELCSV